MPRPLKTLIVTSDDSLAGRIAEALAWVGVVVQFSRAETETAFLAALEARPELIICDEENPGIKSQRALDYLRRADLPVPLIVISDHINDDSALACLHAGAADILCKDRLGLLGPTVTRALAMSALQAEHQRITQEGRELAVRNQLALDSVPDAFVTIDRLGCIQDWNSRATEMFGWTRGEALGRSMVDLIVPHRYRSRCLLGTRRVFERGITSNLRHALHFPGLHLSGEEFPVEIRVFTARSEHTSTVHAFIRDLRYETRIQNDLRDTENRFRQIVDMANVGIGQADPRTGSMVMCNRKLCEITGYSSTELLTMRVQELTHVDDRERDWTLYQRAARGEVPHYFNEKRYVRKDGTIVWVRVNAGFIRDSAGEAILTVAIVEDISEHRLLEAQLRQSQKMEAIGLLAGGMAHDFNNILLVLSGYSDIVLSKLQPSDPLHHYVQEIYRLSLRGSELTRKLLAFSRKQDLNPVLVDVNALLRDLQGVLFRLIGEDIDLSLQLTPELWPVLADPGQIEQVVMNLAVNARDAMPQGGSLKLQTANITLAEQRDPKLSNLQPGDYATITVSDSGCGIEPHILPRIFEPFFTTKPAGQGSGLGLATVHGIIRQSNGHIEVASQPNEGCQFSIYLPRSGLSSEGSTTEVERETTLSGTETILLVDDEESVRSMLCEILQSHGYRVYPAAHAREAQELWEVCQGQVALLVTDLIMPAINGRHLAERLTRLQPRLKVLFISGYLDDAVNRQGIFSEGVPFLQKPFTPRAFLKTVRDLLPSPAK